MVAQLDERLLLLSPRFETAMADAAVAFAQSGRRAAQHAGSPGYPADAAGLRAELGELVPPAEPSRPTPRGLVAPHIDLARGRAGYAAAYGYLAKCEPADLYVVFGTGHQGPAAPVTGLALDWETPLGIARTATPFVEAVHARIGAARPADTFLHRGEHSLEFQVLFLQHVLGSRPFEVAGFLCGSVPSRDAQPTPEAVELIAAIDEEARRSGRRVCYVAGADLAHIGPQFGDSDRIDGPRLTRLESEERTRLEPLERGAPDAFFHGLESTGNPDRVCGTTPMYLTAALATGSAELLHYGQAPADDGSQCVSFCAMAFHGT